MEKFITALLLICITIFSAAPSVAGDIKWGQKNANGNVSLNFYFYWSETCPHCHKAIPFVDKMAKKHPWIKVKKINVTSDIPNIDQYIAMADQTGGVAGEVPAFFYCGQMFTGYGGDSTGQWLLSELKTCRSNPAEFRMSF